MISKPEYRLTFGRETIAIREMDACFIGHGNGRASKPVRDYTAVVRFSCRLLGDEFVATCLGDQ